MKRWLWRLMLVWERRHPEEAKEAAIKIIEKQLGRPLDEGARRMIRSAHIDYREKNQ